VRWVAVRSRKKSVDVWDVKIEVESMIGDVPWGVGYRSGKFGLISLDDSYIGLSSTST